MNPQSETLALLLYAISYLQLFPYWKYSVRDPPHVVLPSRSPITRSHRINCWSGFFLALIPNLKYIMQGPFPNPFLEYFDTADIPYVFFFSSDLLLIFSLKLFFLKKGVLMNTSFCSSAYFTFLKWDRFQVSKLFFIPRIKLASIPLKRSPLTSTKNNPVLPPLHKNTLPPPRLLLSFFLSKKIFILLFPFQE